ncbi:MAG TPA: GlsB/YeaQ/YmgE family stress response membrane protein [Dokdonella sp.]|uniref:GlsB/YeaQ/YmgE family stress response membrane protein n=1 Tax=Dokdonella sp. TaxID=2291710 RepID=UPI0025BB1DD3|nr:GlsB/YeaQ/YmgE family stress response membrane protein [Dokdonella sp.]MBX3691321.1 GlsB/YeaQ/YmgE family stress response membrane protein [Dokdonella sp.]HNR90815.1 GlsB/YeaQ/YmgE family stress response membrane protein [Dokdonella sp.]
MSLESLVVLLVVGGIAGWLAGLIMRGFGCGVIGNIVVGIVGAFLAGWLLPTIGVSIGSGIAGSIVRALIGAIILLAIIGAIKRA